MRTYIRRSRSISLNTFRPFLSLFLSKTQKPKEERERERRDRERERRDREREREIAPGFDGAFLIGLSLVQFEYLIKGGLRGLAKNLIWKLQSGLIFNSWSSFVWYLGKLSSRIWVLFLLISS